MGKIGKTRKFFISQTQEVFKMGKLKTPDWVLEGYKSLAEYDESLAKTSRAPQSPSPSQ